MGQIRSIALGILTCIALAGFFASAAQAEDAFYFESNTGVNFVGEYGDALEAGCWFGPTGNMIPGNAAEDGSVRSDVGPFDGCVEAWGADFVYRMDGQGVGGFNWSAYDWPLADSTLDCEGRGAESSEAEHLIPIDAS